MSAPRSSALYVGRVAHQRHRPPPTYAFGLPVAALLLDLDELDAVERAVPFLGLTRPRLLEVRARDHFDGPGTTLRARLVAALASAGLPPPEGRVRFLSLPRLLGHGFNPVTFWWCDAPDGSLRTAVAEVHNTFGDRHAYVLPAAEARPTPRGLSWEVKKVMHVSPFFDLEGVYRFELSLPGERLFAGAELLRGGELRIASALEAERRPLTAGGLGRTLLTHPAATWTVWTAIHAHAWALWRRGARFFRRPRHEPSAAARLPR